MATDQSIEEDLKPLKIRCASSDYKNGLQLFEYKT